MQRLPVESSHIVSLGYDAKTRVLEIEFSEGRIYDYLDVAPEIYEQFSKADSYGEFFYGSISQRYRYRRVKKEPEAPPAALAFVTGNARKVHWLELALEPFAITVEQLVLPVDEIQSHDPEDIAIKKAKAAFKLAGRPVLVCDNYWSILSLKGFPGAFMSYMQQWLTGEDFMALMKEKPDRTVTVTETLVYHDGKRSKVFSASHNGVIADQPRGNGTSLTSIVIMDGQTETIAEREQGQELSVPIEDRSYHEFAKWYHAQRRLGRA